MKLNVPNILTIARIFITPVFLAVILMDNLPHKFLIACIIFSIGSITDAIDGHLARKNNQITNFGKFLDPIADKILTTSALLAFMSMELCNIWIVMLVLTREFAIASVRMIAAAGGVVIPANIWGKIKTVSQMTFTILIMLLGETWEIISNANKVLFEKLPDLSLISNGLLWITAILTVISGIIYLNDSKKIIDFTK
ncbi:MAG: CDP-diacylglycerol--glycerol-3-phosphate 3-phosphatidyltransferase [Ruminococcaceae bacterium]|nr:CDP-diacylglycerol--glycerol-3-phosphate 3-phosphatidyltransferase [Oscillospiraceae bacterium]